MKRIQLILTCLLVALSATLQAQGQQVKGSIVDSKGEPLAGVSVVVEGTTLGVITGSDGEFTISAKDGQVLNFYLFGMKSQKVTVSGPVLKVTMQEDLLALDEAVVTALGITRSEKSLGYAATTVKNDEIVGYHATNATNALAGKVAGMQISSTTTDPGAATNVIIRGYSSINGNNQPLYVVDGIVIGGLGNIASEDIESLTVLKGAAATALYGSRASNGVIIITTKQGKRGADRLFSIEYSGGVELRQVSLLPVFQNDFGQGWNGTQTFIENGSWGPKFDGSTQVYGPIWDGQQLIHEYSAKPTNIKDFFEIGFNQKHSISLNGSTEDQRATYFLSYSHAGDDGIIPGKKDTYNRNTIAFRSTYTPTEWIKLSSQINFAKAITNSIPMDQGSFVIDGLYEFPRDISMVDLQNLPGAFNSPEAYLTPYGITSPYWAIENRYNVNDSKQLFGKVQADVKPFKFLTFTYRFGFNYSDYDYKEGEPQIFLDDSKIWDDMGYAPSNMNADGYVYARYYRQYETNHDILANYNQDLVNGRLNINAIAGLNINERYATQLVGKTDVLTILTGFWNLSNGATKTTISDSQSKRRLVGLFGDVTLGWDDTIFLELTARNDWSSTLPAANNNYFYPGATLSVLFSNYIPKNDILSFGKVRLAVGRTGNDAGVYNVFPTFSQASFRGTYGADPIVSFPINGMNAFRRGYQIASDSLRPEMTTEYEAGINLQFFNGRIGIDAAYYNRTTSDQIFPISIEPATGYSSMVSNAGTVRNSGVELLLDVVTDFLVGVLGILHGRGHVEHLGPEIVRRVRFVGRAVIDVQGQENALVRIQFHPVVAFLHLLGNHIQAHLLSVQGDGGVTDVIGMRKSQLIRQVETHQVHHVGDVPVIGQQHPVLVRGQPEEGGRFLQLDPVRFLRIPFPGGIAAAADLAPHLHCVLFLSGNFHAAGTILFLGIDSRAVVRRYLDPGKDVGGKGNGLLGGRIFRSFFGDVLPAGKENGGEGRQDDIAVFHHRRNL